MRNIRENFAEPMKIPQKRCYAMLLRLVIGKRRQNCYVACSVLSTNENLYVCRNF